jgi:thymidylate kinase
VFLNEKVPYAVLRNYESLPWENPSRDIDIIIRKNDFKKIRNGLIDMIKTAGWNIVIYLNSDRLITFVCGIVKENKVEMIQWDFFFNTSVYGILLMDANDFLEERIFNGELYHVSKSCEFLDKFLYLKVLGQSYPEKYNDIKAIVTEDPTVINKLKSIFYDKSVDKIDNISGNKLLMQALLVNLKKRPLRLVAGMSRFWVSYMRNYICSNTGFSIGFTGPDGAGKTTIIQLLHKKISPIFATAAVSYHFRPALLPNLGEVAHDIGIKKDVDRDYCNPHRSNKTGILSSSARLLYYSIDYIWGYFVRVKSQTRITRLVIFDRYYSDIICDSRRSRIYLNYKFLYWFGKVFIPSLNYNILLTADADIILARKQELDRKEINSINERIDYLAGKSGFYKIKNETVPENAVGTILNFIFDTQHTKNLKKL